MNCLTDVSQHAFFLKLYIHKTMRYYLISCIALLYFMYNSMVNYCNNIVIFK